MIRDFQLIISGIIVYYVIKGSLPPPKMKNLGETFDQNDAPLNCQLNQ
jgi:hypothetical protein